eukprot:41622-Rhodomonas_salina.2
MSLASTHSMLCTGYAMSGIALGLLHYTISSTESGYATTTRGFPIEGYLLLFDAIVAGHFWYTPPRYQTHFQYIVYVPIAFFI